MQNSGVCLTCNNENKANDDDDMLGAVDCGILLTSDENGEVDATLMRNADERNFGAKYFKDEGIAMKNDEQDDEVQAFFMQRHHRQKQKDEFGSGKHQQRRENDIIRDDKKNSTQHTHKKKKD